MIGRFDEFIRLFHQEIEKTPQKHLVVDAKSSFICLILTTIVELLSDGLHPPPQTIDAQSSLHTFTFFQIYTSDLQSDVLSFITNQMHSRTEEERACAWIILELHKKSLSSTLRTVIRSREIMSCYESSACLVILQSTILESIRALDSLSFNIEGQVIQSYQDYINRKQSITCSFNIEKETPAPTSEEHNYKSFQEVKVPVPKLKLSYSQPNKQQPLRIDLETVENHAETREEGINKKAISIRTPTQTRSSSQLEKELIGSNTFRDYNPASLLSSARTPTNSARFLEEVGYPIEEQKKKSSYRVSLGAFTRTGINLKDIYAKGLRAKLMYPQARKGTSDSLDLYNEHQPKGKKMKKSERLYHEKFKAEEGLYEFRSEPEGKPDVII